MVQEGERGGERGGERARERERERRSPTDFPGLSAPDRVCRSRRGNGSPIDSNVNYRSMQGCRYPCYSIYLELKECYDPVAGFDVQDKRRADLAEWLRKLSDPGCEGRSSVVSIM